MDWCGAVGELTELFRSKWVIGYHWSVPKIFSMPGRGVVYFSPQFPFSNTSWFFGIRRECEFRDHGWIGLEIWRSTQRLPNSVRYSIGLKKSDGTEHLTHRDQVYPEKGCTCVVNDFLLVSLLLTSKDRYAPSDVLTITCVLWRDKANLEESSWTASLEPEYNSTVVWKEYVGERATNTRGLQQGKTERISDRTTKEEHGNVDARDKVLISRGTQTGDEPNPAPDERGWITQMVKNIFLPYVAVKTQVSRKTQTEEEFSPPTDEAPGNLVVEDIPAGNDGIVREVSRELEWEVGLPEEETCWYHYTPVYSCGAIRYVFNLYPCSHHLEDVFFRFVVKLPSDVNLPLSYRWWVALKGSGGAGLRRIASGERTLEEQLDRYTERVLIKRDEIERCISPGARLTFVHHLSVGRAVSTSTEFQDLRQQFRLWLEHPEEADNIRRRSRERFEARRGTLTSMYSTDDKEPVILAA